MNSLKAVTEYLFSDLYKRKNYPFSEEINNALSILKGERPLLAKENEADVENSEESSDINNFFIKASIESVKEFESLFRTEGQDKEKEISETFSPENKTDRQEKDRLLLKLLHPEADFFSEDRERGIEELRKRRKVKIKSLNSNPVRDPAKEIVFTSNLILTVPISGSMLEKADLSQDLKSEIKSIMKDSQDYWFDHPVPIGIPKENNELIYGLRNLSETLEYEKVNGTCPEDSRLTVIISVSVTHGRIKNILHRYMEEELKKASDFKNLDIYIFTENDTEEIIKNLLLPAAEKSGLKPDRTLNEVFGVDGEYGRHYSFLKAIAPLWQILSDREKKGTFKIDLDQVFPEKELTLQTGKSAFEHFMTPMWGAEGIDWKGRKIELGMIAGSLVNEKDIGKSLFETDVPYPERKPDGEEKVFFKQYPMALSTEAEMDVREYSREDLCQMRYHVTGGTNGILIKDLRKYRPFTPTFIGRAEDQGYILSVLFKSTNPEYLRYLHQPGLKMRHDKEAFISDAIKSAKTGTYIGDLVRILAFSSYSDIVEGDFDSIKEETDPFTGSFISRIPVSLVLFKLLMHISDELKKDKPEEEKKAYLENLVNSAAERLTSALKLFRNREKLAARYEDEKKGWDFYYDILDCIEKEISDESVFAETLKADAGKIFTCCKL